MKPSRGEIFKVVKGVRHNRTAFDLSFERKLSINMGKLYPVLCEEVLPGDSFNIGQTNLVRFAPLLSPMMHRVNVTTHYFFVPARLVWSKWEDFITGGPDGSLAPAKPFSNNHDSVDNGSLADYLDIPTEIKSTINFDLLPFKAYHLIWNEYYRDQNLQDPVDIHIDSEGFEPLSDYNYLHDRCWEKDYFTSCLPFAQRGPEVSVPVDGSLLVKGSFNLKNVNAKDEAASAMIQRLGPSYGNLVGDSSEDPLEFAGTNNQYVQDSAHVDLADGVGISMNNLRRLSKLQVWLERNARGGARYVEQLLSHFGVISPDARLQRPEYLGGGIQPVQISQVQQTSPSTEDGTSQPESAGVGELYGNGLAVGTVNGCKRTFSEHGFVVAIMSVTPRSAYQQGLSRKFFRFDKFDYAWPEFGNLGEQEVLNKEIFAEGNQDDPDGIFGYQSRYAEYKYNFDRVNGDFRGNLAFWHLGRIFENTPALNSEFVTCNPRTDVFAVTDQDTQKLWVDIWFQFTAVRELPKFGTPSLV